MNVGSPGREMDQLIAEKVMGLKVCKCWFCLNSGPNGECETCGIIRGPYFSTNPSDAWAVVDHLEKKDFVVSVFQPGGMDPHFENGTVGCTIMDRTRADKSGMMPIAGAYFFGETMPHAVCMATCHALNIEIPVEHGKERVALAIGKRFRLVDIPQGCPLVTIQLQGHPVAFQRDATGRLTPKGEYSVFVETSERT